MARAAEGLIKHLNSQGVEVDLYTTGRKAADYFAFRDITVKRSWTGFSEAPHYEHAHEIGQVLMDAFLTRQGQGGVAELHIIYTHFRSLVSQRVRIIRLLPLEVVEGGEEELGVDQLPEGHVPDYTFEPDPETVLDALLPMYIVDSIKFMLRQAAASELASRQQAMHSATENANELIRELTRQANQARQAEITQEINEIVGGAGALSGSGQER